MQPAKPSPVIVSLYRSDKPFLRCSLHFGNAPQDVQSGFPGKLDKLISCSKYHK